MVGNLSLSLRLSLSLGLSLGLGANAMRGVMRGLVLREIESFEQARALKASLGLVRALNMNGH